MGLLSDSLLLCSPLLEHFLIKMYPPEDIDLKTCVTG
uniref:Uncharacterized protein n=1 Tax=Trichinella nativa TaxID=6335 RepID=A0A0V1KHB9_9BILA